MAYTLNVLPRNVDDAIFEREGVSEGEVGG